MKAIFLPAARAEFLAATVACLERDNEIVIVAIAHQRRRPDYFLWRSHRSHADLGHPDL